jgi:hypothetical protein
MTPENIVSGNDPHEGHEKVETTQGFQEYKERVGGALRQIEQDGEEFLDAKARFFSYIQNRAPHRSSIAEELMSTDEFQTIKASEQVVVEDFKDLRKVQRDFEGADEGDIDAYKSGVKNPLQNMQRVFARTTSDAESLWGTILREHRKLTEEYSNETQYYEEEEFLRNVGGLMRSVCEASETMKRTVDAHAEELNQ